MLAVDPSSPFSGGALLGDRVRMSEHASDPGVYIRSMATRGHLGGLAWAAPQAIRVLDAAGCDVILVETVGVGQSEVEIASQADTTRGAAGARAWATASRRPRPGILEIGDVYVVNKADRDGADATARELNHMLGLGESRGPGDWRPPIVKTVAARGEGIDEVVEALEKHRAWMEEHGVLAERRRARAAHEVETIAVTALRERIGDLHGDRRLERPRGAHRGGRTGPVRGGGRAGGGPDGAVRGPSLPARAYLLSHPPAPARTASAAQAQASRRTRGSRMRPVRPGLLSRPPTRAASTTQAQAPPARPGVPPLGEFEDEAPSGPKGGRRSSVRAPPAVRLIPWAGPAGPTACRAGRAGARRSASATC